MSQHKRICHRICFRLMLACAMVALNFIGNASAQTTQFTYQGKLTENGNPASGQYDFQFKLFDTSTVGTGTQLGSTVNVSPVTVSAGIFTVQLDFGVSVFPGAARFLEIAVKQTSGSTFTTLGPRQPFTSNPYAIRSLAATAADGLSVACLGCITSSQIQTVQGSQVTGNIAGSQISGTIPVASVPAGSANYIQNTTSQQATTNFNVSGDGTAGGTLSGNVLNAATQFNIGGSRALTITGAGSLATSNTFTGAGAGSSTLPSPTSFDGNLNSLFGVSAGANTTTGCCNSFFGNFVGLNNTIGRSKAFFGGSTGRGNTEGSFNAFYGDGAGYDFFSLTGNTTGNQNTFIGYLSGLGVTTGSNNTFLGAFTTGASNLDHATVIGADAVVSTSNTVVLGRSTDAVQIPGALNVSGTFGANMLNATTQFNIGGSRILSNPGARNLFAGIGAGAVNTTGCCNSFFGTSAGSSNTIGQRNSLFGASAGLSNTLGGSNSFFGVEAGKLNTTGGFNSFFGDGAGVSNTTADSNSFFGFHTGLLNTTGFFNSFFGGQAGNNNSTGQTNSFFGFDAGQVNTTGSSNSFFGELAGGFNTTGGSNSFFGQATGLLNTTGGNNSFFGTQAGSFNTTGSSNTFIGTNADFITTDTTGTGITLLGASARVSPGLSNATAIGYKAEVNQSNSLVLGSINGNFASADTNVGIGTTAPAARLHIKVGGIGDVGGNILFTNAGCPTPFAGITFASAGFGACLNYALLGGDGSTYINRPSGGTISFREGNFTQMTIKPGGVVAIEALGAAGAPQSTLCRNAAHEIAVCSSSLRYKTNLAPYRNGLDVINRLKPITFTWKEGGMRDIGLGAEEVEKVEPLLTFRNDKGEIEGVKYSQLTVVLVNAVKQQQEQLEALKKLVCADHSNADVCK
jgi:hypothetical protein